MNEEELIQRITREVLRQLRQGQAGAPAPPRPEGPRVLLLYTGGEERLDEAVAVAGDLAAAGARVRIALTPSARAVLGQARLDRLAGAGEVLSQPGDAEVYEAVAWADVVAVPVLTQNTAAKWALGIRDTPATNLLAAALLMNRRTVACPASAVPDTPNVPYRAMLNGYIEKLRSFGVQMVPVAELVPACLGDARAPMRMDPAQTPALGPAPLRLVTAADVEAAFRRGQRQLEVSAGAVVTPLARELCRDFGVALVGPDGRDGHAAG